MLKISRLIFASFMLVGASLQARELIIKVKGMVCPFCSNSLELALKKRPYVKQVKSIDLQKGLVALELSQETTMSLSDLETDLSSSIREATFVFDGIEKEIK